MAVKSDLIPSGIQNIFYREHPTRKHGVQKDRQWIIVQKIDGKRRVSTIGWSSEGVTRGQVDDKAAEYKSNHRWNQANPDQPPKPICKADEDAAAEQLKQEIERQRKAEEHRNVTFSEYFNTVYLPLQISNKKQSVKREQALHDYHLKPVLGKLTFHEIKPFHVEKVKQRMTSKGQAPRSIQYALALVRQIWNQAVRDDITEAQHPVGKVSKPKINNSRERFFTEEEEHLLLDELMERSPITHDMAIMSLDTGARWGELASLTWQNVNLDTDSARLMDTKSGDNRTIHISTNRVRQMLKDRYRQRTSQYVFPARDGGRQEQVNRVCYRSIKKLGLNDGAEDRRQQLSFHSFRHTCASRLAMQGIPLYTIKEIMGHHSITMTERYAHLMPSAMREALKTLEQKPSKVVKLSNHKAG
jgi:integrase